MWKRMDPGIDPEVERESPCTGPGSAQVRTRYLHPPVLTQTKEVVTWVLPYFSLSPYIDPGIHTGGLHGECTYRLWMGRRLPGIAWAWMSYPSILTQVGTYLPLSFSVRPGI